MSKEERQSPTNAIWLCADHAGLVDKNGGLDYPPGLLHSYKDLHEARIARELKGIHTSFGWVHSLQVRSSPLFSRATKIEFGKLTLLVGENAIGKTALCEWLAAASSMNHLRRWKTERPGRNRVDIEMRYLDPESHSARVSFGSGDYPRYYLDGKFTAVPIAPWKVIFPGEVRFTSREEHPNDLELLADALGLDQFTVLALCEMMEQTNTGNVTRAWFQEEEEWYVLHADVKGTRPGLSFWALSSSERQRVVMEFSILAASQLSERHPTVLILDAGGYRLDENSLKIYGEILLSPTIGFQTVSSIPPRDEDLDKLNWTGWKIIRLQGQPPNVTVSSEIRESNAS